MSNDPTDCRDEALRVAERAEAARSPALRTQLGLLAKNLLRRSVELERLMVASEKTVSPSTPHSQDDPESRIKSLGVLLNGASQRVAANERIVSDWSELVGRMQAEGQDVTMARDLLEAFKRNLQAERANHELVSQTLERLITAYRLGSPPA
jgi:hypothetical protein